MFAYLFVAAIFAVVAIVAPQRRPHPIAWAAAYTLLVLFVGLRHKVGMDWNNYLAMVRYVELSSFDEIFSVAEPAYALLLYVSVKLGAGIYGANFVGAAVFSFGLFRFARTTPLPWLALSTAMPILVIVVAMSANRQAIAIGILLWLSADWERKSLLRRISFTLAAAMFHLSAIFFLMFTAFDLKMRKELKVVLAIVLAVATLAFLELSGGADYYDELYVSGQNAMTYSAGATQHVLLNGLPAMLVLLGRRIRARAFPTAVLMQMAILALILVPAAFFYSVASGRMTLYLFPVSMYAWAALPGLVERGPLRAFLRTAIVVVMGAVLWIWLNYANSSYAHIPYRNALFMSKNGLHL